MSNSKLKYAESFYKIILSDVPQGSIFGPILFDIFINDFFLFINEAKLANFADDNTIYTESKDVDDLIKILEKESEKSINHMIVYLGKCQAMVIGAKNKCNDSLN